MIGWKYATASFCLKHRRANKKERLKKESGKRKRAENDSKNNLMRPQKDQNGKGKASVIISKLCQLGKARECELGLIWMTF